jgi:hypothetical protein
MGDGSGLSMRSCLDRWQRIAAAYWQLGYDLWTKYDEKF